MERIIPGIMENKTCSKPPTSVNWLINQNKFLSNYQQLISRGPHLVLRVDMAMARVGKGLELEELPVSVSREQWTNLPFINEPPGNL